MNTKGLFLICLLVAGHLGATGMDSLQHRTLFVISDLPSNTPHDASIYLASDLDGWYPDVADRRFKRDKTGKLSLLVEHEADSFYFKLTRGSWKAVEGRENGRARPNRLHVAKNRFERVEVSIDSWEDISYRSYAVYMFFLLITSLQGVLLIVAINTIRNKNKSANSILSLLLALITISLLGRASTFDPDVFNWQPKLLFVPELILFTYGPIFYLYMHKLLVIELKLSRYWWHYLPAAVQLLLFYPYLAMDNQTLIYRVLDKELFPYFAITGVFALVFNAAYWVLSYRLLRNYSRHDQLSDKQHKYIRFLKDVLGIKAIYLVLWLGVVLIFLTGKMIGIDLLYISENMIDLLWLLFSLIIFALAFYAVKHPEVLREKRRYKDQRIDNEELNHVKAKLIDLLEEKKVFTKSDLTLEMLAHMVPTSSHTLSRVINEELNQNFTDLINSYRISAFIAKMTNSPDSSFLEVAYQVGFGSKNTFNRAFKKVKGNTPRAYFKKVVAK